MDCNFVKVNFKIDPKNNSIRLFNVMAPVFYVETPGSTLRDRRLSDSQLYADLKQRIGMFTAGYLITLQLLEVFFKEICFI